MKMHFRVPFFGAGESGILDEEGEVAGKLQYGGWGGSPVRVYGADGQLLYTGKIVPFLLEWKVANPAKEERGVLTLRSAFLKKKFRYEAGERGVYRFEAEAFTQDFMVMRDDRIVAAFAKTNGFWSSSDVYALHNESELDPYELIAVIVGIHVLLQD